MILVLCIFFVFFGMAPGQLLPPIPPINLDQAAAAIQRTLHEAVAALVADPSADTAYRYFGALQCQGTDEATGLTLSPPFYQLATGQSYNFSGQQVCVSNCDGSCLPYQKLSSAPISIYPWGCKCPSNRCDENGPILGVYTDPGFAVKCDREARCDSFCSTVDSNNSNYTGYICYWTNLSRDRQNITLSIDPLAGQRWCDCCPQ